MKIDLSKLPEGTKWIAIDSDGDVFAAEKEPESFVYPSQGFVYSGVNMLRIGNVHD